MVSDKVQRTKDHHVSSSGGGSAYTQVRSKIAKDYKGDPAMVTLAREKLLQKLGYDPGKNMVAAHKQPGEHHEKDGGAVVLKSRAENTAESNKKREKKGFKRMLEKMNHG